MIKKRIVKSLVLLLIITGITNAQQTENLTQDSSEILLEAFYSGVGMTTPIGDYLIARIDKNGEVQFEDSEVKNGVFEKEIKKTKISKNELENLIDLLTDESIKNLSNNYKAIYPTIDHTQNLTLKILVDGKLKEIKVENFKPNSSKSRKSYPNALIKIACIAENVRNNAQIKFFFEEIEICNF